MQNMDMGNASEDVILDEQFLFYGQSFTEVETQGSQLYLGFLRREIEREGMRDAIPEFRLGDTRLETSNQDIGSLLDEFAKSEERHRVREKAEQVQLQDVSYEGFSGLLSGLFQEGVTDERVLVLFCFCSDVCLRALRNTARNCFHLLTKFSLRFITSTVCAWVRTKGGWDAVLQSLKYKWMRNGMAIVTFFVGAAIAAVVWHKG